MRIALFSECYTPVANGVVTSLVTLRHELQAMGHTVYVFAPGEDLNNAEERTEGIYRLPALPVPRHPYPFARPFPRLPVDFASLQVDVVHCQHPFTVGRLGAETARKFGLPMIYTAHSLYDAMASFARFRVARAIGQPTARGVVRRFCARADVVTTPTRDVMESLIADGVSARFEIVPNGVAAPSLRPEARGKLRERLGIPLNAPVLLSVGRIAPEKRADILLHAAALLRTRNLPQPLSDFRIVFVGDGQSRDTVEALAEELELNVTVIFAGTQPRETLGDWYALGDIFILASPAETQGLVLIEAMAAGLPCVAADSGGPRELITNGQDGLLVPPDPATFADACESLLRDPALCDRLRQNGICRAADFTPEAMARSFLAVYKSVLK